MNMKTKVLVAVIMIMGIAAKAQQTEAKQPVTAEVLSVVKDNYYSDRRYDIKIKFTHKQTDSIFDGDTIVLFGSRNGGQFNSLICKEVIGEEFPFWDSTYTQSFKVDIDDDNEISMAPNIYFWSHRSHHKRNHRPRYAPAKSYLVSIDLGTSIPILDTNKFTRLVIDHFPVSSQMSFTYYSTYDMELRWVMTDWFGRRISHGFLDVKKGKQSYALMIEGLPRGRYTFILGEGVDAEQGTFTVL